MNALPQPSDADLRRIATDWNFEVSDDELPEYQAVLEYILQSISELETDLAVSSERHDRDAGRPVGEDEDPLNAIVRRCSVRSSKPSGSLLAGKRIALKDNISVAGVPMTAASAALADFVPAEDATVVARILDAGGEIVAMTNMDLMSCSAGGESSIYGPTFNPINQAHASGGSSSGSAACLAYDWVDAALGCDQGGSIRLPSAWCGVVGLKPTHGLVPYTGIIGLDKTFDFCGPMTRTVADAALLLQVIAGGDDDDRYQANLPTPDYISAVREAPADLSGLRIGLIEESISSDVGISEGMEQATKRFADRLRELGATVRTVSIPQHLEAGPIAFDAYAESLQALFKAGGTVYQGGGRMDPGLVVALSEGLRGTAQDLSAQVKCILLAGSYVTERFSGALYAAGQNRKPALRAGYAKAFEEFDLLLTPTAPWPAHVRDESASISEVIFRGWNNLSNTTVFDQTGHPAITLPVESVDGLPAGMQLVARHGAEAQLLAASATVENCLGWATYA